MSEPYGRVYVGWQAPTHRWKLQAARSSVELLRSYETISSVTAEERIRELEQSHDQLRGGVIAAGRQIRKFRHNPENAKMLHLLRNVLREARAVRKQLVPDP